MPFKFYLMFLCVFFNTANHANKTTSLPNTTARKITTTETFNSHISLIPINIQKRMNYTWQTGCPLALNHLRYVSVSYWGFDNKPHQGALIIHQALAKETVQIFKSLYLHHFPIERMDLMDVYHGNDKAAMAANNTSSFNCRAVTGQPGIFSQHSYGRAIDINPKINPYVKGQHVFPYNSTSFVNRNKPFPGKIINNSFIYKIFTKHGWDWAGNWYDLQDYQHFEKRANGKKRNPYGY